MKTNPLMLVFFTYIISIPLSGYLLRIAERPTQVFPEFLLAFDFPNAMWSVIVTMATSKLSFLAVSTDLFLVGYGDFTPQTFLGRLIVFFVSIIGTTITSLMVVSITNLILMGGRELKVLTFYEIFGSHTPLLGL